MTSASYTESVKLYREDEIPAWIKKQVNRKIRKYKRKVRRWIRETLIMSLGLFCIVVLPVVGMFVHWLVVGY